MSVPSANGAPRTRSPLAQALDVAVFGPMGLAVSVVSHLPEWVDKGRDEVFRQLDVARVVGEHASRHGQKRLKGALVDMGILPGPMPPSAPRAAPAPGPAASSSATDKNGEPPVAGHSMSGRPVSGHADTRPAGGGPREGGRPSARQGSAASTGAAAAQGAAQRRARQEAKGHDAVEPEDAGRHGSGRGRAKGGPRASSAAAGEAADGGAAEGAAEMAGGAEESPDGADLAIPGYDSLSAFQVVQRLAGLAPAELESVRRYETAGRGRRTILTRISQLQTGRP